MLALSVLNTDELREALVVEGSLAVSGQYKELAIFISASIDYDFFSIRFLLKVGNLFIFKSYCSHFFW